MNIRIAGLALAFTLLALAADAQTPAVQNAPPGAATAPANAMPENRGGGPRPMPPEARAACTGKAVGETCNFTDRENRPLSGTCMTPPPALGETALGCRPNRPPRQASNRPDCADAPRNY